MPQSVYGPVDDDEVLVRVLVASHYKGANIQTSAFKLSDIISDGVSLSRLRMMNVIEFQEVAEDIRRLAGSDAVRGAYAIRAQQLRNLRNDDGNKCLCVFDDPVANQVNERDNPAHCMAVSPTLIEPVDAQQIRFELMKIFREARYLNELWDEAA